MYLARADSCRVGVAGVMRALKTACYKRNIEKQIKNMAFKGTWRNLAFFVFEQVNFLSEKDRELFRYTVAF
jgi:hypothetical protein